MGERARYPHRLVCRNDLVIEIRPLREKDIPKLRELYLSIGELDRALLRENVLDRYYANKLKRQIQDKFVHRLAAWRDDKIVSLMTLYRSRGKWLKHTCMLRAITHPDFRRFGITMYLMEEVIPYAKDLGIEKLYVHILPEQNAAARLVKNIGFQREATFEDHVKDEYNMYHDVRVYSMDLQAAYKAMESLLKDMNKATTV